MAIVKIRRGPIKDVLERWENRRRFKKKLKELEPLARTYDEERAINIYGSAIEDALKKLREQQRDIEHSILSVGEDRAMKEIFEQEYFKDLTKFFIKATAGLTIGAAAGLALGEAMVKPFPAKETLQQLAGVGAGGAAIAGLLAGLYEIEKHTTDRKIKSIQKSIGATLARVYADEPERLKEIKAALYKLSKSEKLKRIDKKSMEWVLHGILIGEERKSVTRKELEKELKKIASGATILDAFAARGERDDDDLYSGRVIIR